MVLATDFTVTPTWKKISFSFYNILLILLTSKLFILSFHFADYFDFGFYFNPPQIVLIFLCSIYFLRKKKKKSAFLLPIIIPVLGVLVFLKPDDFHGGVGLEGWGFLFALFFSVPAILTSYVCLFLYLGFNALRKRLLPSVPGGK